MQAKEKQKNIEVVQAVQLAEQRTNCRVGADCRQARSETEVDTQAKHQQTNVQGLPVSECQLVGSNKAKEYTGSTTAEKASFRTVSAVCHAPQHGMKPCAWGGWGCFTALRHGNAEVFLNLTQHIAETKKTCTGLPLARVCTGFERPEF